MIVITQIVPLIKRFTTQITKKKFVLNCQIFNKDIFQKYLEIKMLFFHKNNIKTYFYY